MVIDAIKLLLFPALMAFAASSDLLTMTISNRVSLLLLGGFFVLALMTGMPLDDRGLARGRRARGLRRRLRVLRTGLDRRRRRQARGGHRLVARLRSAADLFLYASLFGGALTFLMIQFRFAPLPRFLAGQEWAQRLHRMDAGVPYGIALAASALFVYPETSLG